MLANANWERPLYMSMTVGDKNYPAVLKKFFVHEGLAYRITPFDWSQFGYDTNNGEHPIDIERFSNNIINRFEWGGLKENKDYYADESIRRMISTHRNLVTQLATEMINSDEDYAKIISVLEKIYNELPEEIVPYDALRDNTIALADVYNILYHTQNDYKSEIEQLKESDDYIKQAVVKELYLGDDTLALLKQRRNQIANSILKNELEHIIWYNTLKPYQISDVMLYHRVSLIEHSWKTLDGGENCNIAREDIINALSTCFNTQVSALNRMRNRGDVEIKRMVIGTIYQTLDEMNLSNFEMRQIEQSLRLLMKQSK